MPRQPQMIVRAALAAGAIGLALAMLSSATVAGRLDTSVLLLFAAAAVIVLVPWDKLSSLKAVGVEITLNLPRVKEAVDNLDRIAQASHGKPIDNERVRRALRRLEPELALISDCRVLWIDDNPYPLGGLRRLFRALGIDVVVACSTAEAGDALRKDNDFDLIISDLMRNEPRECITFDWLCANVSDAPAKSSVERVKLATGEKVFRIAHTADESIYERREGVNFVRRIRMDARDPVVRTLPVLFYVSFSLSEGIDFARAAITEGVQTEVTNSAETLVPGAIEMLARSRSRPISVGSGQKVLVQA